MPPRTTPTQDKTAPATSAPTKAATKATPAAGGTADKPATRRRTTRPGETTPPRTRARRSAGITVDDDTTRFSLTTDTAPDPAPAQPAPVPQAGPPARVPAPKKEWESEIDESKVAISVRLPLSLKARLDGLTDYLALNDPDQFPDLIKQVANQTEVFNLGLHRFLTLAEDELNGGKPLPVRIRRGR